LEIAELRTMIEAMSASKKAEQTAKVTK